MQLPENSRRGGKGLNAQYNVAAPDSLPARVALFQRRKMFRAFINFAMPAALDAILDLGVTSDRSYAHSNYFAAWYPHKTTITAAGLDDASFLSELYPGLVFVRADGRDLPFTDRSFDYVHSSAVIEHVGDRQKQARFLGEAWRVSRKGIFVTTPNRWFPIEFHTVLPLLHWLPPRHYRRILAALGRESFACERNLNLLSGNDLARLADGAGIESARLDTVALMGWPTNLMLTARKSAG